MITQKELKELLDYNPTTGVFTRIKQTSSRSLIGDVAGYVNSFGYRKIHLTKKGFKKLYCAHVLAWFYVYGVWPASVIDHIDRNKDNNAICNLRLATQTQNLANAKMWSTNTSGFRGVCRIKPRSTSIKSRERLWKATISVNKKNKYLGIFSTPEEAGAAHDRAALELWGEFYNKAS